MQNLVAVERTLVRDHRNDVDDVVPGILTSTDCESSSCEGGRESLELSDENLGIGDGGVGYAIAESKAKSYDNSVLT